MKIATPKNVVFGLLRRVAARQSVVSEFYTKNISLFFHATVEGWMIILQAILRQRHETEEFWSAPRPVHKTRPSNLVLQAYAESFTYPFISLYFFVMLQ